MEIEERFVEIEDFPNYMISSYGTVLNVKLNRELIPTWKHGYLRVGLYNEEGQRVWFHVSRLVAKAFFLRYTEEMEVNYRSDNHQDCSVNNISIGYKHSGPRRGW